MRYIKELTGLALRVPKLDESAEFYSKIWGLEIFERGHDESGHDVVRLRGSSPRVSLLTLIAGSEAELAYLVFTAHNREAVDQLAENLRRHGYPLLAEPGASFPEGEYGLACTDTDGRECRVIAAPLEKEPIVNPLMPINLSHIVLNTPSGEANRKFFIDGLGMRLTDSLSYFPMTFFGVNHQHHCIALWSGAPRPFLNHIAYEMQDIESFLRKSGELVKAKCKLIAGPGRHTTGDNTFCYFLDPNNLVIEITTDMEQIENLEDWVPRVWDSGEDKWGFGVPLGSEEMRKYST